MASGFYSFFVLERRGGGEIGSTFVQNKPPGLLFKPISETLEGLSVIYRCRDPITPFILYLHLGVEMVITH